MVAREQTMHASQPERTGSRFERVVLGSCLVVAVIFGTRIVLQGYGADNDTWLMLGTWDGIVRFGHYVPSRFTGNPIPEVVIGFSSHLGGFGASNAVSVCLGLGALFALYRLVRMRGLQQFDAALLTSVLAVTPTFVISASTSHDYVYGLSLFLLGWLAVASEGWEGLGTVCLGLSVGSRASYLPLAVIVLLGLSGHAIPLGRRAGRVAIALVVGALCYLPAFIGAKGTLDFVGADRPDGQGLIGVIGRASVKSIDLLGLGATLIVLIFVGYLAIHFGSRRIVARLTAVETYVRWLVVAALATWVLLPVETSYLLALESICLVALSNCWPERLTTRHMARRWLLATVFLVALFGAVDVQVLRYTYASQYGIDSCTATEATTARIAPFVRSGPLLDYPSVEARDLHCNQLQRSQQARLAGR